MKLNLDAGHMRGCMALWRDAIAIRPGLAGAPAVAVRAKLLAQATSTVAGWLDLLRLAAPETDADRLELADAIQQITAFQDWSDEARSALALLQNTEHGYRLRL
jgi:hypothetical protein